MNSLFFLPFSGKRIVITGATGLIGSALVRELARANARYGLNLTVIAMVRDRAKAEALFGAEGVENAEEIRACLEIAEMELGSAFPAVRADFAIHAAAPTSSRMMVERPVEVMEAIVGGTARFLEYVREQGVGGSVVLSTLEVYGRPAEAWVREGENGQLDTMCARASYPEGKRASEALCAAYVSEYGVDVKVARLAQTFGAGVSREDSRVFAQFARSVWAKRDIVLHTAGATCRNYCSISDAVQGILLLLQKGKAGEAYNVASPATYCSIRELAEAFSQYTHGHSGVRMEAEKEAHGYAPEVKLRLDTSKLEALGFRPTGTLPAMIDELIRNPLS